jgi:hypothetical protein
MGKRTKVSTPKMNAQGEGVKTWPTAIRYEGMFKEGLAHGKEVKIDSKVQVCREIGN